MKTISRISLLFLAALIYSYFRYAFFTPENLVNLPVFVSNKGLAMAAALSFSMAFLEQWLGHSAEALTWFRAGTWGSVIHIPMTLSILRPSYFHEFFIGERLSLNGESVILFGTLTAGGIYLLTRQHLSADQRWWLSMATMLTLASHTFFMGMARGVKVSSSQAYLPPMWLLSLIGVILGIGFLALAHPFKPQPEGESGHHI